MHENPKMRNKQMEIHTYKILPFLKIPRIHVWKIAPFLFRSSHWQNTLSLSKKGTSMVYALVASGGAGWQGPLNLVRIS